MSIGYACLTVGVPDSEFKSCRLQNASSTRLIELITHNLTSLENIIDYNIQNKIKLFRISSDLIPFGSSPVNQVPWWELFAARFAAIGAKIQTSGMRVSMHPGQYTVLNSPNKEVVTGAIADLNYHTKVLESLGMGVSHKVVLHIGGVYQSKNAAMQRFIINFHYLDDAVKQRLVLENDDKSYNINDVLELGANLKVPVVFDKLHQEINPGELKKTNREWIDLCRNTWTEKDGLQKIHYSEQDPDKQTGSHSSSITIAEFLDFYASLAMEDLDIMLEVKDKNLSAVKCINCTSREPKFKVLEREWKRYKYKVLENSPAAFEEISQLLGDKSDCPAVAFYKLIEVALQKKCTIENSVEAALQIWGCFKNQVSGSEQTRFMKNIEAFKNGTIQLRAIKNSLWKMAVKYHQSDLSNSYYFIL